MKTDMRFAFRQLLKAPGFSLLAIITLRSASIVVLGTTALLACLLPARRATFVNPTQALRSE